MADPATMGEVQAVGADVLWGKARALQSMMRGVFARKNMANLVKASRGGSGGMGLRTRACWGKVKFGVAMDISKSQAEKEERAQQEEMDEQVQIANDLMRKGLLVGAVDDATALKALDYHKQADLSMYTPEALGARAKLRADEGVRGAINEWWKAMRKDVNNCVTKSEYIKMNILIQRALNSGPPEDEDEELEAAEEDWVGDCRGRHVMAFKMFFGAIFELVDLWCETTESAEYVKFAANVTGPNGRLRDLPPIAGFDYEPPRSPRTARASNADTLPLRGREGEPPRLKRLTEGSDVPAPPAVKAAAKGKKGGKGGQGGGGEKGKGKGGKGAGKEKTSAPGGIEGGSVGAAAEKGGGRLAGGGDGGGDLYGEGGGSGGQSGRSGGGMAGGHGAGAYEAGDGRGDGKVAGRSGAGLNTYKAGGGGTDDYMSWADRDDDGAGHGGQERRGGRDGPGGSDTGCDGHGRGDGAYPADGRDGGGGDGRGGAGKNGRRSSGGGRGGSGRDGEGANPFRKADRGANGVGDGRDGNGRDSTGAGGDGRGGSVRDVNGADGGRGSGRDGRVVGGDGHGSGRDVNADGDRRGSGRNGKGTDGEHVSDRGGRGGDADRRLSGRGRNGAGDGAGGHDDAARGGAGGRGEGSDRGAGLDARGGRRSKHDPEISGWREAGVASTTDPSWGVDTEYTEKVDITRGRGDPSNGQWKNNVGAGGWGGPDSDLYMLEPSPEEAEEPLCGRASVGGRMPYRPAAIAEDPGLEWDTSKRKSLFQSGGDAGEGQGRANAERKARAASKPGAYLPGGANYLVRDDMRPQYVLDERPAMGGEGHGGGGDDGRERGRRGKGPGDVSAAEAAPGAPAAAGMSASGGQAFRLRHGSRRGILLAGLMPGGAGSAPPAPSAGGGGSTGALAQPSPDELSAALAAAGRLSPGAGVPPMLVPHRKARGHSGRAADAHLSRLGMERRQEREKLSQRLGQAGQAGYLLPTLEHGPLENHAEVAHAPVRGEGEAGEAGEAGGHFLHMHPRKGALHHHEAADAIMSGVGRHLASHDQHDTKQLFSGHSRLSGRKARVSDGTSLPPSQASAPPNAAAGVAHTHDQQVLRKETWEAEVSWGVVGNAHGRHIDRAPQPAAADPVAERRARLRAPSVINPVPLGALGAGWGREAEAEVEAEAEEPPLPPRPASPSELAPVLPPANWGGSSGWYLPRAELAPGKAPPPERPSEGEESKGSQGGEVRRASGRRHGGGVEDGEALPLSNATRWRPSARGGGGMAAARPERRAVSSLDHHPTHSRRPGRAERRRARSVSPSRFTAAGAAAAGDDQGLNAMMRPDTRQVSQVKSLSLHFGSKARAGRAGVHEGMAGRAGVHGGMASKLPAILHVGGAPRRALDTWQPATRFVRA